MDATAFFETATLDELQRMFESAYDVIYRYRMQPPFGFEYINPAVERLTGYSPQECLADPNLLLHRVHPEDAEKLTRFMQGENGDDFEVLRWIHKDGHVIWTDHRCKVIYDSVGRPLAFEGIARNITDRMLAENLLSERERHLQALNDLTRTALAAQTIAEMAGQAAQQVGQLFGADGCYITLWDAEAGMVYPAGAYGVNQESYASQGIQPGGETLTSSLVRERRPLIIEDTAQTNYVGQGLSKNYAVSSALGLPLISAGQVLGGLIITYRRHRRFSSLEVARAEQVAGQLALAMSQVRLLEDARRRVRELTMLHGVAAAGAEATGTQELIERAARCLGSTFHADHFGVFLLDEAGKFLTAPRIDATIDSGQLGLCDQKLSIPAGAGIIGRVAVTGQPVRLGDVSREPGYLAGHLDSCSELCVPMKVNGRTIGVVNAESHRLEAYSADDERLIGIFASQLATAIEKLRLLETERSRTEQLAALAEVSAALRSARNHQEMIPIILDQVQLVFGAHGALMATWDPAAAEGVVKMGVGLWSPMTGVRFVSEGILGAVVARRASYCTQDLPNDPLCAHKPLAAGVRAAYCVPLIAEEQVIGVLAMGCENPIDVGRQRMLDSIAGISANAFHRASLHEETRRYSAALAHSWDATIEGWSRALELRDIETQGHSHRVMGLTVRLARALGVEEAEIEHLRRGALLHDIGKMGIPDSILLKPGPLNVEEWTIMRRHPQYAYDLLGAIPHLAPALDIPYGHHERWDGSGYPRGLSGEAIPFAARLFAVVDVWDALHSHRPYAAPWPTEKVCAYLAEQAGKQFDPRMVKVFLGIVNRDP